MGMVYFEARSIKPLAGGQLKVLALIESVDSQTYTVVPIQADCRGDIVRYEGTEYERTGRIRRSIPADPGYMRMPKDFGVLINKVCQLRHARDAEAYKGDAFKAETVAQIRTCVEQNGWWTTRSVPEVQLTFRRVFRGDTDKVDSIEGAGDCWISGHTLVIGACKAHMCPEGFVFTVDLFNGKAAGAMFLDRVAAVHLGDYKDSAELPTPMTDWIVETKEQFSYTP